MCCLIEVDGRLGMRGLISMWFQAVRYVGEAEQRPVPVVGEQPRVTRQRCLEDAQEVDHLVVAPVADVAPRVVLLDDFPIDPVAADPVGVVAIGGHGAEKDFDHRAHVLGLARDQRFPVLEDVAPVAFVVDDPPPARIPCADRELVPRSAWVAMASAEGQRQVAQDQPLALGTTGLAHGLEREFAFDTSRPRRNQRPEGCRHRLVAASDVSQQVVAVESGTVDKDPAAHDVEQDVRAVVRCSHPVSRCLDAIGTRQKLVQARRVARHRFANLGRRALTSLEFAAELEGLDLRTRAVDDLLPPQSRSLNHRVEVH